MSLLVAADDTPGSGVGRYVKASYSETAAKFSVNAEECAEQVSYSLSAAEDRVSEVLSSTRANASMT